MYFEVFSKANNALGHSMLKYFVHLCSSKVSDAILKVFKTLPMNSEVNTKLTLNDRTDTKQKFIQVLKGTQK